MATAVGRMTQGSGNPITATYTRRTSKTFDPTAATPVGDTESTFSLVGTLIDGDRQDGPMKRSGTLVFLCPLADFEAETSAGTRPGADDSITINGSTYEVADRWGVDPAGAALSITIPKVGA